VTTAIEKRLIILENKQHQPDFVPARWISLAEHDRIIEKGIVEQIRHPQRAAAEGQGQRADGVPEWVFTMQQERREKYLRKQSAPISEQSAPMATDGVPKPVTVKNVQLFVVLK